MCMIGVAKWDLLFLIVSRTGGLIFVDSLRKSCVFFFFNWGSAVQKVWKIFDAIWQLVAKDARPWRRLTWVVRRRRGHCRSSLGNHLSLFSFVFLWNFLSQLDEIVPKHINREAQFAFSWKYLERRDFTRTQSLEAEASPARLAFSPTSLGRAQVVR